MNGFLKITSCWLSISVIRHTTNEQQTHHPLEDLILKIINIIFMYWNLPCEEEPDKCSIIGYRKWREEEEEEEEAVRDGDDKVEVDREIKSAQ